MYTVNRRRPQGARGRSSALTHLFCALLAMSWPLVMTACAIADYDFVQFDATNPDATFILGINNQDQVVGVFYEDPEHPIIGHGFKSPDYEIIDFPDARTITTVYGINAYGDIDHPSMQTEPTGINNAGQIAGTQQGGGFLLSDGEFTSFSHGPATRTGAINDAGQIVGSFIRSFEVGPVGFVRDVSGSFSDDISVPGADLTRVSGINNLGQVVGYYWMGDRLYHGFLLSDGQFTTIDFPGALYTVATGINDDGVIVGYFSDPDSQGIYTHGFLARPR